MKGGVIAVKAVHSDVEAFFLRLLLHRGKERLLAAGILHIDGEKKDYNENYLVNVVLHDGRWLVVSHSI